MNGRYSSRLGFLTLFSLSFAAIALLATPSSASYMQKCDKLISAWKTCKSGGGACKSEQTVIEEECRCHQLIRNEWKLIMAAVGKDGVCAPRPPGDPVPIPPEEPHRGHPPSTEAPQQRHP
ncbi:MAG: hypothetical protein AB7O49_16375 [Sphingomonadales bacterium]